MWHFVTAVKIRLFLWWEGIVYMFPNFNATIVRLNNSLLPCSLAILQACGLQLTFHLIQYGQIVILFAFFFWHTSSPLSYSLLFYSILFSFIAPHTKSSFGLHPIPYSPFSTLVSPLTCCWLPPQPHTPHVSNVYPLTPITSSPLLPLASSVFNF